MNHLLFYFLLSISILFSENRNVVHTEIYYNGNIKSITNHVKYGKGIRKWSHEEYDIDGHHWFQN